MKNQKRLYISYIFFFYLSVHAMEDQWVLLPHSDSKKSEEEQKKWALQWAIQHGHPKIIKKLADPSICEKKLNKVRNKFIRCHGRYSLEQAIMQGYLYMVKEILAKATISFKAETFALAAHHGKIKTTRYIAQANPNLFTTVDTLNILYNLFNTAIHDDRALRPIETVLKSNISIEPKQLERLLEFGIKESKEAEFIKCSCFLESELAALRHEQLNLKPVSSTL